VVVSIKTMNDEAREGDNKMEIHVRTRRVLIAAVAFGLAAVSTGSAWAGFDGSLTVDRVTGTFFGLGGEFNVGPASGPALQAAGVNQGVGSALDANSFQSFCVEFNEHVKPGDTYVYNVNSGAVKGGVSGQIPSSTFDPLDPKTAYLYTQFINGTLTGETAGGAPTTAYDYTVGSGRVASAGALQNAIWYIEGEVASLDAGLATEFYNAAVNAAPTDIGKVRILNLFKADGGGNITSYNQDQLVIIPTPAALLMALPLLGFLGAFRFVGRKA